MPKGELSEGNRLALKNLAQGTTDETLMKVMRDLSLNPTKVFIVSFDKEACAQICFADYKSLCDAAAIIDKASKEGSQPFTRANNRKAQFSEASSVFVRNLPTDVTDDGLFQEFQKAGSVINCQVLRDHQSNSKQMGLVNFINTEG